MIQRAFRAGLFLPLIGCFAVNLAAQESGGEPACGPDEVDMGDYCIERSSDSAKLRPGARRATPFRIRSMMPGRVGAQTAMPGAAAPAASEPAPGPEVMTSVEGQGFGVQLGVFSSREKAVSVAREAAEAVGGPFVLSRMQRDTRILWACIHGPFPDKSAAVEAQRRLREQTPFGDAFVKPLEKTELLDINHARTEK